MDFSHGLKFLLDAIISTMAGISAGMVAKSIVFPFDLLKKRLQMSGFEEARKSFGTVHKYTGLLQMMRMMWNHEGLAGFYKGLMPSLLKAAVSSGSAFLIYEQTCHFFAANELSKR